MAVLKADENLTKNKRIQSMCIQSVIGIALHELFLTGLLLEGITRELNVWKDTFLFYVSCKSAACQVFISSHSFLSFCFPFVLLEHANGNY